MTFLGLHKDPWHNTGACAIKQRSNSFDLISVSEERLDRVKDSRAFPLNSILACNQYMSITSIKEYDAIIMDYIEKGTDWRFDYKNQSCSTNNLLALVDSRKIHLINHHLCHAYATFMTSPFDEAAILVIDGRGSEKETQSLFIGKGNEIFLVNKTKKLGIGLFYAAITKFIGFGKLQEGKTMGLAPYGGSLNSKNIHFLKFFWN